MDPETVRPALYDWAPPHGREPEPPPLDAALMAFERAREAAGRDEWEEAANEFLAAAALVPMLEHRYAASLAAMREISYRNAALAWSATREGDAGTQRASRRGRARPRARCAATRARRRCERGERPAGIS